MTNKDEKNIVLLIPQLRHGGAERVVSRLSFLLKEIYNVKIVVFDDSVITYETGCEIISLKAPSTTSKGLIKRIINIVKRIKRYRKLKQEFDIDITYSFGDTANIVNVFSKGKDKKIISIRGYKRIRTSEKRSEKYILRPISKLICKKSDCIISVSELIRKTLIKEYKINPNKVVTIYNGYDTSSIKDHSKENLEKNINEQFLNYQIIITAGTFRYEKGYWHLLKALSIVLKSHEKVKLAILGSDYKDYKTKIDKLAKDLNISDSILYLGYDANPYKYFSKSKLYVLSSVFEGFPNSLVEAMSCKLPIVATDCPSGPREILSESSCVKSNSNRKITLEEYGILVSDINEVENFNIDIESCDISLANAIEIMLENKNNHNYRAKSELRSLDFSYDQWLRAHIDVFKNFF